MGKVQNVPPLPASSIGTDRQVFDEALRANVSLLRGRLAPDGLAPLAPDATLEEVVKALNQVIARLT